MDDGQLDIRKTPQRNIQNTIFKRRIQGLQYLHSMYVYVNRGFRRKNIPGWGGGGGGGGEVKPENHGSYFCKEKLSRKFPRWGAIRNPEYIDITFIMVFRTKKLNGACT